MFPGSLVKTQSTLFFIDGTLQGCMQVFNHFQDLQVINLIGIHILVSLNDRFLVTLMMHFLGA